MLSCRSKKKRLDLNSQGVLYCFCRKTMIHPNTLHNTRTIPRQGYSRIFTTPPHGSCAVYQGADNLCRLRKRKQTNSQMIGLHGSTVIRLSKNSDEHRLRYCLRRFCNPGQAQMCNGSCCDTGNSFVNIASLSCKKDKLEDTL